MKSRIVPLILVALLGACSRSGEQTESGGVYVVRSLCPQVAIPGATGDVTLFDPAERTDSAALDVVATITNVRSTCSEDSATVVSNATFDVIATRRDAGPARQVILPYFTVAVRGGDAVVAKRIGNVALTFAAGSTRSRTSAAASVRIARAAVTLPADIQRELTRERRTGDADAAIDPLSDVRVRSAVSRATFEHLVGFQLTQQQLQYNATR